MEEALKWAKVLEKNIQNKLKGKFTECNETNVQGKDRKKLDNSLKRLNIINYFSAELN